MRRLALPLAILGVLFWAGCAWCRSSHRPDRQREQRKRHHAEPPVEYHTVRLFKGQGVA